jgi:acyl carrier protein
MGGAMIEERLTKVFRDIFDDEKIVISREMTAADVEEWDSLSHINLLVAIEKEFSIAFSLGEVKNLKNVGGMIDLISEKTR